MKYPPVNKLRSHTELQQKYIQAVIEVEGLRREKNAERWASKKYKIDRDKAREQASVYKKKTVTLTQQQKANDEAKACGYWSGGAAITVTIIYEICEYSGNWLGGPSWAGFWKHQAVHSTALWCMTMIFAFLYKASRK